MQGCEAILTCGSCGCASSSGIFGADTWVQVKIGTFGVDLVCAECAAELRVDARAGAAPRNRSAARERFRWGWQDAARFRLGLGPVAFGEGPRRDRNYVDGWMTCMMLNAALRPAQAAQP